MPAERISKVVAAAGIASRRGADELVAAGRVAIDGRTAKLGERVDIDAATVTVDGRPLPTTDVVVHVVLNKPIGVTSTVRDRHAERTVVDLVPADLARATRLYPVGRLDRDSEGLLLLTNDGPWADRILHPRHGVEREYAVAINRPLAADQADALQHGVALDEGVAIVGALRPQTETETRRLGALLVPTVDKRLVWYRATLGQGWKRQLRRMFAAVHAPVQRLVRVRIGSLRLEELRSGEARELTSVEVRRLGASGRQRDHRL
ncbi:MAG: pseudouridine synthase [Chloroflexota bacterium]